MSRLKGMTLIEVVCAIGLMGTLLVMVVTACTAHAKQIRHARLKIAAIEALDREMTSFQLTGKPVRMGHHLMNSDDRFIVDIRRIDPNVSAPIDLRAIRLEVYPVQVESATQNPLTSVEILVAEEAQ